eukprot:TRINITY_DN9973_c0_g1_i1.p1 TRINITY_DN9973_c0_g1~~TRINITY_DN9973_c0_g1_i1.p1  ORF type:complete len:490 (-),score=58.37 TRINITY_DN9973_c0_g1_i1:312-1781(-)
MDRRFGGDQSVLRTQQRRQLTTEFESPEGIYKQVKSREYGTVRFDYFRPVWLTLFRVTKPRENIDQMYIIFNVGDVLHIQRYFKIDEKPSFREVIIPKNGKELDVPKCHAWNKDPSNPLLAVGTKSGLVLIIDLYKQIATEGSKPAVLCQFQSDNGTSSEGGLGMCTDIAWVPIQAQEAGNSPRILAAFSTGQVLILQKGNRNDLTQVGSLVHDNGGRSVTAVACSPNGLTAASAGRDGVLRLFDLRMMKCIGGFKGYYGALLCVGWSPDGKYVVTGGEDDLIAVYGLRERNVIAWGEGHKSWVSAVAFDTWCDGKEGSQSSNFGKAQLSEKERVYRIGSVGQDTMICLWDIQVDEEEVELQMNSNSIQFNNAVNLLLKPTSGMMKTKSLGGLNILGQRAGSIEEDRPLSNEQLQSSQDGILTNVRREEMEMVFPVNRVKIHLEPISCIVYEREVVFTVDHSGSIKAWVRPDNVDEDEDNEDEGYSMQR